MRARRLLLALSAATVAALVAPAAASALSCAYVPEDDQRRGADVVFDAVLLSGPRQPPNGVLASPARAYVVRYVKGRGPRVVSVGTDTPLLLPGDRSDLQALIPGLFAPHPGHVYRVYGDTPKGAGGSTARGVLTPDPCAGTFEWHPSKYLRAVRGGAVSRGSTVARPLRGPGVLRCVRVLMRDAAAEDECIARRRRSQLVTAVVPAGGDSPRTAIAVAGPDLARIDVATAIPAHAAAATARGPARVAVVELPLYAERPELVVTATLRDGTRVTLPESGTGVLIPEPERPTLWAIASRAPHPAAAGVACATFDERAKQPRDTFAFTPYGECGSATEGFFAVRYASAWDDAARASRRDRTIVFGVAPPVVSRVLVTGPDGEREAVRAGAGGAFGLVYPPSVGHEQLTVVFELAGGERRTWTGQRDANVLPPPRSGLDSPR